MNIHGYSVVIPQPPDHLFVFKDVFLRCSVFSTYLVFNPIKIIDQTLQSQKRSHIGKIRRLRPNVSEKYSQNNEGIHLRTQTSDQVVKWGSQQNSHVCSLTLGACAAGLR